MQIDPNVVTIPLPEPLWLALTVAGLAAVAGALAADLAGDAGHLERWRQEPGGWGLGVLGNLIMGLVAAALLLAINPPADSWLALVSTAVAAGIGAEAIIQGYIAGPKALTGANAGRQAAEARIKDIDALVEKAVDDLKAAVARASVPDISSDTTEQVMSRIEAMRSAVHVMARAP